MAAALTVLLVDNDEDCRALTRDAIRAGPGGEAHAIVELADGQAALDYLRAPGTPLPALIFLDVEMPRLGGLEALAALRRMPALVAVPIVMLTGVADEAYMRRAAALGANSYTVKPARADQFLHTVRTSATYWLTIHQYPAHHLAQHAARR